jgi:hypothetical protein
LVCILHIERGKQTLKKQHSRDDPEEEISLAIEQWLVARRSFLRGTEADLEAYCHADRRLLAAFAADWAVDNPQLLAPAYQGSKTCWLVGLPVGIIVRKHELCVSP